MTRANTAVKTLSEAEAIEAADEALAGARKLEQLLDAAKEANNAALATATRLAGLADRLEHADWPTVTPVALVPGVALARNIVDNLTGKAYAGAQLPLAIDDAVELRETVELATRQLKRSLERRGDG